MFDSVSAATCATLAQVMPVFLVAYVAQEAVRPKVMTLSEHLVKGFRTALDAALVLLLLLLEVLLVVGVQSDGIQSKGWAGIVWILSLYVGVGVISRWLLVLRPVRSVIDRMNGMLFSAFGLVWPGRKSRRLAQDIARQWPELINRLATVDESGRLLPADEKGRPLRQPEQKKRKARKRAGQD